MNGVHLVSLELLEFSCALEWPLAGVTLVVHLCMLFPLVDLRQHRLESWICSGELDAVVPD